MQNIPISVVNLQGDGYHILLEIEIFDRKFNMVLDTGASQTVLDRHTLIQSGIDELLLQSTDILSTGLGTNSMESHTLKLPYLKIGEWFQKNIQVAVLDLSTINYAYEQMKLPKVIGVLGSDIFVQYGAVINYKKKKLWLNSRKQRKTEK